MGKWVSLKNKYQSGDVYGQLTLTGKAYRDPSHRLRVEYVCNCGKINFTRLEYLLDGTSKSCGCGRIKHGMAATGRLHPLYTTWMNMKNRCYQKSHRSYIDYGGKGLTVCAAWKEDFNTFYNWAVENGWQQGLTIDRIKNSMGYSPDNCRWATQAEQNRNTKRNIWLTAFGETRCLVDWLNDKRCVVARTAVMQRIFILKWEAEKALTTPSMNYNRSERLNAIKTEYNGVVKNLLDWCIELNLDYLLMRGRLYQGWSPKDAFETSKITKFHKKLQHV